MSKQRVVWKAGELLQEICRQEVAWADIDITGISLDSRHIEPGFLFIALAGQSFHGMAFAAQAIANGASLVLAESPAPANDGNCTVPVVEVAGLSRLVASLAARFYHYPSRDMRLIGITGTNGKTSISHFLAQSLADDWRCALIGTIGNGFPGQLKLATHTTPDAVSLQSILADLRAEGAKAVAMEVSSHALDQSRVDAIAMHTALFTNLTRDHLDYHGSMAGYAQAKLRLFARPELKLAVINADDALAVEIARVLPQGSRLVRCYFAEDAQVSGAFIRLLDVHSSVAGLKVSFDSSWGEGVIDTRLVGAFNAQNLLLSAGVLMAWGIALPEVIERLRQVSQVPGRMQVMGGESGKPLVVIDYAHTPDALEKALCALRPHASNKLYCVFGCGGDRDQGKRPLMGELAERLADSVVLTDDNPRHERSQEIIRQIMKGMEKPMEARVIADRQLAIQHAIEQAREGDVVLVAGKGHEQYQQIGDDRLPFNDVAVASEMLEACCHD